METPSVYDDLNVIKSLVNALKAAEEHGYTVILSHSNDNEDKLMLLRPDNEDFPFTNVRAAMKKTQRSKPLDCQQNMEVRLKIVSTK